MGAGAGADVFGAGAGAVGVGAVAIGAGARRETGGVIVGASAALFSDAEARVD
jgi:hypothetical protein